MQSIRQAQDKSSKLSKPQASAKTMADLLKTSAKSFVSFKKGEIVEGTVAKLSPQEILLDLNGKSDALVLEKDKNLLRSLLSILKVGDKVQASVLNPESDMGNTVVSLRRFLENKVWEKFKLIQQNQTPIKIVISGLIKGGFLAATKEGLSGFLPYSQSLTAQTQTSIGITIEAFISDLNREARKIIFSQKKLVSEEEFKESVKNVKIDQKIDASITSITPFGLFASVMVLENKSVDGLIHISEISWEKTENLEESFEIGQKIEVLVIGVDRKGKRLDLSIRRLTKDPFEEMLKKYQPEKKVKGKVSKITGVGVILDLEEGIEGLIRKEKIPPTTNYKVGDEITATVSEVDAAKHRIYLTPVLLEKPIGYR